MFVDTQVVSYAHKGAWQESSIFGARISSIVANELLLVQGAKLHAANYYVPHPSRLVCMMHDESVRADHPFHKRATDSLIMDFCNEYESIVEYGSHAIAAVINQRCNALFNAAVSFLPKHKKKIIQSRFQFLLSQGITCVPISEEDVSIAQKMLLEYRAHHNIKDNFRNSWNDLLILASAYNNRGSLISKDKELNRFGARFLGVEIVEIGQFLNVSAPDIPEDRSVTWREESKGYINTSWRVFERNRGHN